MRVWEGRLMEGSKQIPVPNFEPQLLANGDILVPIRDDNGAVTALRLEPGEEEHAAWLQHLQGTASSGDGDGGWIALSFVLAVLVPIAGILAGVIVLARGRGAQGAAIIVLSILSTYVYLVIFGAVTA
jgi:hypothetical protein